MSKRNGLGLGLFVEFETKKRIVACDIVSKWLEPSSRIVNYNARPPIEQGPDLARRPVAGQVLLVSKKHLGSAVSSFSLDDVKVCVRVSCKTERECVCMCVCQTE
jgi:hypothetical protein